MIQPLLLLPSAIPDGTDWVGLLLRYTHIFSGIVWIGMLYFFNLVNVNFQKEMAANLDPKSNHTQFTKLMPAALWWFRWGAMLTVLTGFTYYMIYMSIPNAITSSIGKVLGIWAVGFTVAWMINRTIIDKLADAKSSPEAKAPDRGMLVGILEALVLIGMIALFIFTFGNEVDAHVFNIAIGGGFGMIMFMNVWMIIWPKSRQIIAAREQFLKDGTAVPPEMAKLGRRSFLASRTNTWMSIVLLLFMVLAAHSGITGAH